MTEEGQAALFHDANWRRSPDMWSKLDGGSYQRVSMGIGDAINLSAAAIYLARRDGPIIWHVFEGSEKSVRSIFALHPEIKISVIPDWWMINPFAPVITPHSLLFNEETAIPKESKIDLFEHVYAVHGIPYEVRWDLCPIEEAVNLVPQDPVPKKPYAFVHQSPQHGCFIDLSLLPEDLPWLGPDRRFDVSILAYVDVLKNAEEIHVHDSAFLHLVDSIDTPAKLFLHQYSKKSYVKGWNSYKTRHNWVELF